MCAEVFRGSKSSNRIELSRFVQVIVILSIWVSSALGVVQVDGECLGWSIIVYMSSGVFKGRESSNRIELSWLVQDFWWFGLPAALGVGGGVDGSGGGWVGASIHVHTHACTYTYACTCMCHKHDNFMQMAAPIGGIPWEFPIMSYAHVHMCMHMHVHMCGGTLSPLQCPLTPTPTHPLPREPWNQSKFNSTWTNWDISILFEDLKSVETPLPMGWCIVRWVGLMGRVRSNTKFFSKCWPNQDNSIPVWRFMICRDTPTHGCVWVDGFVNGCCQVKWLKI